MSADVSAAVRRQALAKTSMCRSGEACDRLLAGRFCAYAHSPEELRCVSYALNGYCRAHAQGRCEKQHTASPLPGAAAGATAGRAAPRRQPLRVQADPDDGEDQEPPTQSAGYKPRDGIPAYVRPLLRMAIPRGLRQSIAQSRRDARRPLVFPEELIERALSTDRATSMTAQLLLEYAQCLHDVRIYDLEETILHPRSPNVARPRGSFYAIFCPGLAEKRPSVVRGDAVKVKESRSGGAPHIGYVYFVNLDHVVVNFNERVSFQGYQHVVFSIPVTTFNKLYTALKTAAHIAPVAQWASDRSRVPGLDATRVGQELGRYQLNELQKAFITDTCVKPRRLHLLHGPPGTGKTTTIVHLIATQIALNPKAKILVMTPSNQSADLIVQRLAAMNLPFASSHEMLRIVALSRDPKLIPVDVLPYVPLDTVCLEDVTRARVVVTTLMSSSIAFGITPPWDPAGAFTHFIVDEAAQATEQEVIVGLQFLTEHPGGVVVLGGDHKQLGPVIRNAVARRGGMSTSALERLCVSDEAPHTMLVDNYRAHPWLVALINPTYGGLLRATRSGVSLVYEQPIRFIHVDGNEKQDPDSPSWFNETEKQIIIELIDDLVIRRRVRPCDIVVLAPYKKQVEKIRQALHYIATHFERMELKEVEVCSVEMYQGREACVVLLSCVRSTRSELIDQDIRFDIGFLRNPKRLNVALSRAQDLLIMVGNTSVLAQADDEWRRIVVFALGLNQLFNRHGQPHVPQIQPRTRTRHRGPAPVPVGEGDADDDGDVIADTEWNRFGQ